MGFLAVSYGVHSTLHPLMEVYSKCLWETEHKLVGHIPTLSKPNDLTFQWQRQVKLREFKASLLSSMPDRAIYTGVLFPKQMIDNGQTDR